MNTLDIQIQGPVARVYLNRPEVRNAFNDGVIAELTEAFTRLGADASLRAIVLGGHGKAFCAGADLNWMRAMAGYTWEQNRADAQALADMLWTLYRCPLPIVGRVHGDCYAGGMGLAAVCDVLVAAEGVSFCLSEARLGLLPATIGPYVVKALGEQASRRYFTTAERFDAERAAQLGFVHECVPAALLDATVDGIVATLVANGPAAVKACKALVQDVAGRAVDEPLRAETARRIADIRVSDEGREGIASFLNKRDPRMEGGLNFGTAELLALAAALGWASGMRLYAVVFLTGLAGHLGWIPLPDGLQLLQQPVVLWGSGALLLVEFVADKVPLVDSAWDALHTVIRVPAGAALAAGVFGGVLGGEQQQWALLAALLGGTLAATSHVAKASTRAAVNTSPEPFSNIGLSLLGDLSVPALLWLAWEHPLWAAGAVLLGIVFALVLIHFTFKFVRALWRRLKPKALSHV